MPLNFPAQPPRQPIHRCNPAASNPENPLSAPLWRHPRWTYFLSDLNKLILKEAPAFRPHFLELLKRIDSY
jgi:hypothetical protein